MSALSVTDLQNRFSSQKAAFAEKRNPSHAERYRHLSILESLLKNHIDELVRTLAQDFGHRSVEEAKLIEIFPALEEIRHAKRHLRKWMKPRRVGLSFWFQPSGGRIVWQPLGVVGVIVPWNYPVALAIGPLVGALAAGNRVMIKMSEFTPRTGELLARLIGEAFDPSHVTVLNGGVEIAEAFSGLPFDHLLFTGSTRVGKAVMKRAAENLTPVTLELGGKSPTLIGPEADIDRAARWVLYGKSVNAGQTCIAPDYVLIPEDQAEPFAESARKWTERMYGKVSESPDYSSLISEKHYARIQGYLDDAAAKGARIVRTSEGDPESRKLGPVLLMDVNDGMRVMQEEVFGPLLPIVTYRTLDEAIAYVNGRERPLALYYFGTDSRSIRKVIRETVAGGVSVNATLLHFAQADLPFGGVGASGIGHYHGRDGFETFSKKKPVYFQSRLTTLPMLMPPYGKLVRKVLRMMLK